MWRLAGRVSVDANVLVNKPALNSVIGSRCHCAGAITRHYTKQASEPPPLSQQYEVGDSGSGAAASAPPPGAPGKGGSGKLILASIGLAVIGGGALLLLDPLNLYTVKKPLMPPPSSREVTDKVVEVTDKVVEVNSKSQSTSSPLDSKAGRATESTKPKVLASAVGAAEQKSTSIATIVEESVEFLISGKRTPEEEAARAKRQQLADEARQLKKQEEEAIILAEKSKLEEEKERLRQYESAKQSKNSELEQLLSGKFSCAVDDSQKAITLNALALKTSDEHAAQLRNAMEAKKESVAQEYWPRIFDLRDIKTNRLAEAKEVTEAAKLQLDALFDIIEKAKNNEMTSSNPALTGYENQIREIESSVLQSYVVLQSASTTDEVMDCFYEMLLRDEDGFERDLQENLPGFQPGYEGDKFSQEELTRQLEFVHERYYQLKRQLRKQECMEDLVVKDALMEQKDSLETENNEKIRQVLDEQRSQCSKETLEKLREQEECDKKELRDELARQGLAQTNQANDLLAVQEAQLKEEFERTMNDRVEKERCAYVESLAGHIDKIDNLIATISERADVDKRLTDVRNLMSSAQNFMYTMANKDPAKLSDYQMIHIADAVESCRESAPDNEFMKVILSSIPTKTLKGGVHTVTSLEQRFNNVFSECKKHALYPSSSNLVSSALSKAYGKMSLFSVKPKYETPSDFNKAGIDGMDTKDLLVQAQYFMNKHHLAEAVKCMVKLEGLPRHLAQDWIEEARSFLEVQQLSEALYSYALSRSLGQVI